MKKQVLSWLLMLGAVFVSTGVLAKCEVERPGQEIHIKEVHGNIVVVDKNDSKECRVKNNKSNNENSGSKVVWIFHDLNCLPGKCLVRLNGLFALDPDALKCDLGSVERRRCKLQVNLLKDYCDEHDDSSELECKVTYTIEVDTVEIDPTIIIRPRPIS